MERKYIGSLIVIVLVILTLIIFTASTMNEYYSSRIEERFVTNMVDNGDIYLGYLRCSEINRTAFIENNQTEYLNNLEEACKTERIIVISQKIEDFGRTILEDNFNAIGNQFIQNNLEEIQGAICK